LSKEHKRTKGQYDNFLILSPICMRFSIEFHGMYQHICCSSYRGSQKSPTPQSN